MKLTGSKQGPGHQVRFQLSVLGIESFKKRKLFFFFLKSLKKPRILPAYADFTKTTHSIEHENFTYIYLMKCLLETILFLSQCPVMSNLFSHISFSFFLLSLSPSLFLAINYFLVLLSGQVLTLNLMLHSEIPKYLFFK